MACPLSVPWRLAEGYHEGTVFWIIVAARCEDETKIRGAKQPAEVAIKDIGEREVRLASLVS